MKRILCAAMAWLMLGTATGQTEMASTSDFLGDPFAYALYTFTGETSYTDDRSTGRARMHETDVSAMVPFWSRTPHMTLAGLSAKWNRFEFTDPELEDEDLFGIALPLAYLYEDSEPWSAWIQLSPGLYGDMHRARDDDFKVQFFGLAMYQWSPRLNLSLGGAYDSAFGEDRLYPMGGLIWRSGEDWLVNLVLPFPSVWWKPMRDWALYADVRPAGDKWKVRGDTEDERLEFTLETWRLGAGAEFHMGNGVWVHLGAGADLGRRYEFTRGNERVLRANVDDGWFVRAGVLLR